MDCKPSVFTDLYGLFIYCYVKEENLEYIGTTIAIVSLFLSIYAVRIGRKNRSYDLLFKFYEDLKLQEPRQAKNIDDIIPPEPNEKDEAERSIDWYNSSSKQEQVETKFNLLCYAVEKGQIPLEALYTLFAPYLQSRMEFWPKHNAHRIGNYPYTVSVIDKCIQKGLLPINKNKGYLDKRRGKLRYWKAGVEALAKINRDLLQKSEAIDGPDHLA